MNRVLVAGIGNIFLGDDGFGVEVAQRLRGRPVPEGARVEDFGIRGLHLAYELLEGYEVLVLIDALPLGEAPGTLTLFEPDVDAGDRGDADAPVLDAHSMSPAIVLGLVAGLGGRVDRVLIVGCEPADTDDRIGLSAPVAAAVDPAVAAVEQLLAEVCAPAYSNRREANP